MTGFRIPDRIMTYVKVVSLALEFGRSIDFVSHDPGNGLLHIFHPLHHLGLPHQVDILDEGVVLLPEGHGGGGGVGLSAWPALALPLLGTWAGLRSYADSGIRDSPLWVRPPISHVCPNLTSEGKTFKYILFCSVDIIPDCLNYKALPLNLCKLSFNKGWILTVIQ